MFLIFSNIDIASFTDDKMFQNYVYTRIHIKTVLFETSKSPPRPPPPPTQNQTANKVV